MQTSLLSVQHKIKHTHTVFVPTAEEREQSALDGQVAIVDTGVAFHTYTSPDPVGLTTKVSQFVVPVLNVIRL